jgi:hypothetical protein
VAAPAKKMIVEGVAPLVRFIRQLHLTHLARGKHHYDAMVLRNQKECSPGTKEIEDKAKTSCPCKL